MKKIKMLKQKLASGTVLEVDQIVTDEVSENDKAILVRMGAAEYVKESTQAPPPPPPQVVTFNKKSLIAEIEKELTKRGIPFEPKTKKADLLDLLPDEAKEL